MDPVESARLRLRAWRDAVADSAGVFARDVGNGLLEVGHNSLAALGLAIVALALFALGRPDLRHAVETEAFAFLQARHDARLLAAAPVEAEPDLSEPEAIARATASDPKELSRAQASVAMWLSRKYRVAPEPVSRLVQEAWKVGDAVKMDPTLILAVMAVESSFNPFAQSPVGAQGLMQVMTKVHDDKYEPFGGRHAAFDPVTNLRVGVQVLKECIARAGSLDAGLRFYVGAANSDDGGYALKVLVEQNQIRVLAGLKALPLPARRAMPEATATAAEAAAPVRRASVAPVAPAVEPLRGAVEPMRTSTEPATPAKPFADKIALAH